MTARRHYAVVERGRTVRGGGWIIRVMTYRTACGLEIEDYCDDPRSVDCQSCLRSLSRDLLPEQLTPCVAAIDGFDNLRKNERGNE